MSGKSPAPRPCALAAAIAVVVAAPVHAAPRTIEEVVVTATRREESLQNVPVAVTALTGQQLDDLGVANFSDYLLQLPGVTAGGSGPGQNTVYIRGVASTTPNLTTAGVAGLAPNVAFYLDQQPLAQPGRNLDVYAADLERVEVLAGPQGTLFGASSQAGNVRLITKKPDFSGTYGSVKVGAGSISGGDVGSKIEAVANVPVSENFALRGVLYSDKRAGYIDNVAGTRDASESARFRPEGTVRANGVPVSAQRAGFQSTSDLSGVTFLEADNSAFVEKDFNDTTYRGGRLSALWNVNEDWQLRVSYQRQDLESDGVFFTDPTLGDLEIQRYADDRIEDRFDNTNWTLEGLVGKLQVVYTGAFTNRDTDQLVDYSDYLFVGQYLPYYICDGSVSYPGGAPAGTCQPPNLFVDSTTDTRVMTHEVRFLTDPARNVRVTAGAFYSDLALEERNDFNYPGSVDAVLFGQVGFSDNYPQMTGFTSDPGPFPPGVIFRNDVRRTDEQLGVFGEVTFDLNDRFSVVLGARWYDIGVDFDGSANSSFCNGYQPDADAFGTDISDLYNADGQYEFIGTCDTSRHIVYTEGQTVADIMATDPALSMAQATQIFNALGAPDTAAADGVIFKASLDWRPTGSQLYYLTWSQGFRPGLLNRPGGAQGPGGYTVPFELDTDDVTNIEIGWKSSYLDNSLRFNGSLFYVDIKNLQTTIFDPSIVNLFFSDNAADARVTGVEGDLVWLPESVDGLTVYGAFSLLDSKITRVLTPTNDVVKGDELAFAPAYQGNLRARYEWGVGNRGWIAHVMPGISFSSKAYSDIITINRDEMDSWVMGSLTAGVSAAKWSAELFVDNLTDERAEVARSFVFDRQRVTYAPPRTIGVRMSFNF